MNVHVLERYTIYQHFVGGSKLGHVLVACVTDRISDTGIYRPSLDSTKLSLWLCHRRNHIFQAS